MQVKVHFFVSNHHFYLHNRHLVQVIGVCYAGKSYVFFWKLSFYLHNRHLAWLLCRWNWCFFLRIALLPGKIVENRKKSSPGAPWRPSCGPVELQRGTKRSQGAPRAAKRSPRGASRSLQDAPWGPSWRPWMLFFVQSRWSGVIFEPKSSPKVGERWKFIKKNNFEKSLKKHAFS